MKPDVHATVVDCDVTVSRLAHEKSRIEQKPSGDSTGNEKETRGLLYQNPLKFPVLLRQWHHARPFTLRAE